jgi:hypothetical protein
MASIPALGLNPASCAGVKRSVREADHSPTSNAEVKNEWSYTSTPPYVFLTWCLINHRDDFTYSFTLVVYITTLSSEDSGLCRMAGCVTKKEPGLI